MPLRRCHARGNHYNREQVGKDASPIELKRRLRAGMGWCQGRVCGPALAQITETGPPLLRSGVLRPVLISRVADTENGAGA